MAKLENYNGSVELMAGITQKGGGDFALVEANAVQTKEDGTRLDAALEELYSLVAKINELLGNGDVSVQDQIAQKIDQTLSVEGAAADAKVTGDEISSLRSRIFVGTYAEYEAANAKNEIPLNALVVITDDATSGGGNSGDEPGAGDDDDKTSSKLGTGVLGYMILG